MLKIKTALPLHQLIHLLSSVDKIKNHDTTFLQEMNKLYKILRVVLL